MSGGFRIFGLGYRKNGSEARWREEVMPGGLSGEVRPTASGSDAGAFAPGGKNQSVCSRKPVTFGDQSLLRKSQFSLRRR